MSINTAEIEQFFNAYNVNPYYPNYDSIPEVTMPTAVRQLVFKDINLKVGGLETDLLRFDALDKCSSDIANKIDTPFEGFLIPILRRSNTSLSFAFSPVTGKYLGQFNMR